MNVPKRIQCAMEYATKVYQGVQGCTLENARKIFKNDYIIVKNYYDLLVTFKDCAKMQENLKNSILHTGIQMLNYSKQLSQITNDIFTISSDALDGIASIYKYGDIGRLGIQVLKLSKEGKERLNLVNKIYNDETNKTFNFIRETIVKNGDPKILASTVYDFFKFSKGIGNILYGFINDFMDYIDELIDKEENK